MADSTGNPSAGAGTAGIDSKDTDQRVLSLADRAWAVKYSEPSKAVELAQQAIDLSMESASEKYLPKSYLCKAMGLLHLARFKEAEASALSGLEIYAKRDEQEGLRAANNILGSIYFRWGKLSSALEHYLEAMRIHLQLEEDPDPGLLSNLGAVYLNLGETEKALDHYTRVTEMAGRMKGPDDLKVAAVLNMGEIYNRMEMYDAALEKCQAAYGLALKADMKQAQASADDDIGQILCRLERFEEAEEHFLRALRVFRNLEDLKGEAMVLLDMGTCYMDNGREDALDLFQQSNLKFRSINDSLGVTRTLIGIAKVMLTGGRTDEAGKKLGEAMEIAGFMNLKPQLSCIHSILADVYEEKGDFEKSLMQIKLHYDIEQDLRSERASRHLRNLRIIHQVEEARKEAALQKVRNLELEQEKRILEDQVRKAAMKRSMEEEDKAATAEEEERVPEQMRVLVVESDPTVVQVLKEALGLNGYAYELSSSMEEASGILKRSGKEISCLFTDLLLPDGSGMDLIREVLSSDSELPIIAGTQYPVSKKDIEFLAENRIVLLEKPYNIDTLILNLFTMIPD